MAIQTATLRTSLASTYAAQAQYMAAYSTAPGASAGTEISGGSPAYARKAPGWGTAANSTVVSSATPLDIPSGSTVAGVGFHTTLTGGAYLDGVPVTSQPFSSQGVYTVTATYVQS